MTIIYPTSVEVKSRRRFGAGILPRAAAGRPEPSPADRRWWAEESDRLERERAARAWDRHADELAADALALDLVTAAHAL